MLLSEKGEEARALTGTFLPEESVTITPMADLPGYDCGLGSNIWDAQGDPALLISLDDTNVSCFN